MTLDAVAVVCNRQATGSSPWPMERRVWCLAVLFPREGFGGGVDEVGEELAGENPGLTSSPDRGHSREKVKLMSAKFLIPAVCLSFAGSAPGLDLNGDGLCDIWQARYGASALHADADHDGDGFSQREEAAAGTDPFDPRSRPATGIPKLDADGITLECPTQPGKSYRLFQATTAAGPWTPVGDPRLALGESQQFTTPKPGTRAFFRLEIRDIDTDGDGISDWAELQLAGFDRLSPDSFNTGTPVGDANVATAMLHSLANGDLTAATITPSAFEKEITAAVITYSRTSPNTHPLTLFIHTRPVPDRRRSSPGPGEFTLRDSIGSPVTRTLVIPAGAASASLHLHPVPDAVTEVPEHLQVTIGGSSIINTLAICDARPIPENQRLFIAYLRPLPGVSSAGSGIATIRLPGDNDTATVSLSFSNLNSPVNSTQVQTTDDAILQSIPPFAYNGQSWPVRASQSYPTDQAVLDSLISGAVELNIFTAAHVAGEISGVFQPAVGFTEMPAPPPPPPIPPLTGTDLDREIIRFLTQATHGPTPGDLTHLRTRIAAANGDRIAAFASWIDEQFALPSPNLLDYTIAANRQGIESRLDPSKSYYDPTYDPNEGNRRRGWWLLARHAPDQLRQRAALALSEIFVISDNDSLIRNRAYGSAHYYDMLKTGASGTFGDLLRNVATHPMMGWYLSHLRNPKATYDGQGNILVSPDENFAREIMQLFSIGLIQLHPDGSLKLGPDGLPVPAYSQTDITELARVFTGWSFSVYNNPSASTNVVPNTLFSRTDGTERFEDRWTHPMKNFPAFHDTGEKSVLGLTLPAGRTGEQELAAIASHLASHPNTAPFISRRLIQRLVTANPSAGYLHRVATAFAAGNGNLAATLKAILLDPEARSLEIANSVASYGKPREPLLRYTAFVRAFNGTSQLKLSDLSAYGYPAAELAKFPAGTTVFRMGTTNSQLGQTQFSAPSVFNWFQPDYTPAGILSANGVASPELQIANENSVIQATNYIYNNIYNSSGNSNVSSQPDQQEPPYLYSATGHYIRIDTSPLDALYMKVLDVNRDGVFTNLDIGTHNNPSALRNACEAVLDHIDLLLCAGNLKARYGDTPGLPRRTILDSAVTIRSANSASNTPATQDTNRRDRIRHLLWLVSSSPEAIIQK